MLSKTCCAPKEGTIKSSRKQNKHGDGRDPVAQETVAFGDVSVEDSRNLTANNSRKILRLAQCQVDNSL